MAASRASEPAITNFDSDSDREEMSLFLLCDTGGHPGILCSEEREKEALIQAVEDADGEKEKKNGGRIEEWPQMAASS
jgi:hypothetical protein